MKALLSCQNLSPYVSFRGTRRTPLCQLDTHTYKAVVGLEEVHFRFDFEGTKVPFG